MTTVIIGAGPAGLAGAFWRLQDDPSHDLLLLEASERPGGWVRSELREDRLCEIGPQAVRPSAELDALVEALGAQGDLVPAAPAAKARWIGRNGRLLRVPMGPGQLLGTRLLTLGGKLRLLKEPFVRKGDPGGESVSSFVARRFGQQTAPLVQAMVSGIFAGDADRLEMESAFPMLAIAEREHGSVFKGLKNRRKASAGDKPKAPRAKRASLYTFVGGMEGLVRRLAEALGGRLRTGDPARAITREGERWIVHFGGERVTADEVVFACPASATARLLAEVDGELAQELGGISFASLASVYVGFPGQDLPETLQGFGFLLEPGEDSEVLGAIYCHSLFPHHAPEGRGLARVMIGGARHPGAVDLSDERLTELSIEALRRYAGLGQDPDFVHVVRVRDAIPQYESGHAARMARIEGLLQRHPGLALRGNSYKAVALAGQLGRSSGTDEARAHGRMPRGHGRRGTPASTAAGASP